VKQDISAEHDRWFPIWERRLASTFEFVEYVKAAVLGHKYEPSTTLSRLDTALALAMGFAAAILAYSGISLVDARIYDSWNIYFHADGIRVLADITDRFSEQWHSNVHPIFSILTFPAIHALMATGLQQIPAAGVLLLACAAVSGALFYLALRGMGLSVTASLVFGAAFLASATFIHWYTHIETYAFAATTIVGVLYMLTSGRNTSFWAWTLISASALAITVTNWALALAAGFCRLPFPTFLKTTSAALLIVVGVACVQNVTFPTSKLFFNPLTYKMEFQATQPWLQSQGLDKWVPLDNMRSALISSLVAPPPVVEDAQTPVGVFRLVTNQHVPVLSYTSTGLLAVACWVFLLVAGLWGAARTRTHWPIVVPIAAYLAFQVAMHSVFGEITFLHAGNFFPALVMLAAFGWFTPLRKLVLMAALAFTAFAGLNNNLQFRQALELSSEIAGHLEATGEALCVPTCARAQRGR
jgi:hypothetical protein